jgi:UDP-glucose 4-epimerase
MRILAFGGTGFVGLNIAAVLLGRGHAVTLFDRAGLPPDAKKEFAAHGNRLTAIQGDVTDSQTVEEVIAAGYEASFWQPRSLPDRSARRAIPRPFCG